MISKNKIKLIRSLATKKGRDRAGCFVAEGPKVCHDLLAAGFHPRFMAYEEGRCPTALSSHDEQTSALSSHCEQSALPKQCELAETTADELRQVSFLQHPQGVLGVFEMPAHPVAPPDKASLYLALDGIQDPGNLGTIIRVADWFGVKAIYCSPDTADCWNPKVVQATMGSIARVPIYYTRLQDIIHALPEGHPVYGTLLDGSDLYLQPLTPHGLIVMGNEGNGISAEIRQCVNRRLLIPNFPKDAPTAESLNVAIATAITLAEFRRRTAQ